MKVLLSTGVSALLLTMLAGCTENELPAGGSGADKLAEVAQAVARGEYRVTADQLAGWIIEGRKDFVVVDLRNAGEFATAHIDGAENLPLTELVSDERLQTLPRDRKIVLYSNGSETAAAAAAMLRLAGHNAALLVGGYNFWNERVLNPDIPAAAADDETPQVAERRAIACYFAGGEAAPGATPAPAVEPARPAAFTPPLSAPVKPPPPRAFREGC